MSEILTCENCDYKTRERFTPAHAAYALRRHSCRKHISGYPVGYISAEEAARRAGVTKRQVGYWKARGWLGRPDDRYLTREDLAALMQLAAMVNAGMYPRKAAAILAKENAS